MPGAENVKVVTIERERHVTARLAMVLGVMVAIGAVVAALQVPPTITGANESLNNGIMPTDANLIAEAPAWHAAAASEIDGSGAEMLGSNGIQASGRVEGDYSGTANGQDAAYLLINAENKRRVVIIAGHQNRYDSRFPTVSMIARIPKEAIGSIQWMNDKAPKDVLGDGLLFVREPDKPESGVVVFLTQDGMTSASPKSWHDVTLK
jgi:hypothetical protein